MIYLKIPEDDTTEFFERLKGMMTEGGNYGKEN